MVINVNCYIWGGEEGGAGGFNQPCNGLVVKTYNNCFPPSVIKEVFLITFSHVRVILVHLLPSL